MKRLLILLVILGLLTGAGFLTYPSAMAYWKARHRTTYRTAEVTEGDLISTVNSTGTVQPVRRVSIGSFVSGPISQLFVDFNSPVREGMVMARIDPRLQQASVAHDRAALSTAVADAQRIERELEQAIADEKRAYAPAQKDPNLRLPGPAASKDPTSSRNRSRYISQAELDQYRFARMALAAQWQWAKANVEQARAGLRISEANLEYTNITSPVDGVVIDRKVDPGQTVAAAFQTPDMFVVAPEMEKRMLVLSSVDEADIGLIQDAYRHGQPVHFTVDAYPDDLFEGEIQCDPVYREQHTLLDRASTTVAMAVVRTIGRATGFGRTMLGLAAAVGRMDRSGAVAVAGERAAEFFRRAMRVAGAGPTAGGHPPESDHDAERRDLHRGRRGRRIRDASSCRA